MKSLIQYIKESTVDVYRLNEVEATYFVQPDEIILQAPETYNESNIQIYMDDLWLSELPSNEKYSEKFFGINHDSIIDVKFEYDTFEHTDIEPKEYIEWKSDYDKHINDDVKLEYFRIKNLKYIITFDRFDLTDVDDDTVEQELIDIFKAAESNNHNKYPIEIKFDEDSLKYRK